MVSIDDIKNISIIGTGLMGGYIAQLSLLAGFEKVTIYDIKKESIEKCVNRIEHGAYDDKEGFRAIEAAGKMAEGLTTDILLGRLVTETDLEKAVEDADLIFEVVPEIMEIKQEVFKNLGKLAPKHSIFASNSSSFDIGEISKYSGRLEQSVGIHFLIPLFDTRLVEFIKGKHTSDNIMETCIAFCEKLPCPYFKKKMYVARIEKERPGFISIRMFSVLGIYLNWFIEIANEKGITFEEIESAASIIMGGDMGFFALLDYSGLDIILDSMNYMHDTLTSDIEAPEFVKSSVKAGNLGAKTGKGYFSWPNGRLQKIEKEVNLQDLLIKAEISSAETLLDEVMAITANEGCRLLEEGVVSGYSVVNRALAARGLPSGFGMAKRKYKAWTILLEQLAEKTGKDYFKPCEMFSSGKFVEMR